MRPRKTGPRWWHTAAGVLAALTVAWLVLVVSLLRSLLSVLAAFGRGILRVFR